MMITPTFNCMYDNCDKGFDTLRKFKRHITEDHQQTTQQLSINDCMNSENNADDELTEDNENINGHNTNGNEEEDDTDNDDDDDLQMNGQQKISSSSHKKLDAQEQKALNGLLKLCQFNSPKPNPANPNEHHVQMSEHLKLSGNKTKLTLINNIPVIPLVSPKNKSPKTNAVRLKHNESSAKFYKKPKSTTSITNVSVQAISPQMNAQRKAEKKKDRANGRKRKLSDMNCNDLAHLTLKLQDKIADMDADIQTSHKQLMMVRQLYRKKAKLNKKRRM